MSAPIRVGDLVMVVRGHRCIVERCGGVPFRVTGFMQPTGGGWTCDKCKMISAAGNEVSVQGFGQPRNIPLSYLIKIDPRALPETINTDESIPE